MKFPEKNLLVQKFVIKVNKRDVRLKKAETEKKTKTAHGNGLHYFTYFTNHRLIYDAIYAWHEYDTVA